MSPSVIDSLSTKIIDVYNRLQIEEVLQIPSSSITIQFHSVERSADKGVFHTINDKNLNLEIHATNKEEGVKVTAALFSHLRLKIAENFGVRHGSLLYLLPIIHLLTTLLIIAVGSLSIGFLFGIIYGMAAIVTIPLLVYWVSLSLENRRTVLKENLKLTTEFTSVQEIDKYVAWLGTKTHSRKYWIKRLAFYEIFNILVTGLMILLYFVE